MARAIRPMPRTEDQEVGPAILDQPVEPELQGREMMVQTAAVLVPALAAVAAVLELLEQRLARGKVGPAEMVLHHQSMGLLSRGVAAVAVAVHLAERKGLAVLAAEETVAAIAEAQYLQPVGL